MDKVKRLSRYGVPQTRPIRVQPRDLYILRLIFDLRYVSSLMIHEFFFVGCSKQARDKRLRKLKGEPNQFIQPHSREDNERNLSSYVVYSLTDRGIDLLLEHGRVTRQETLWRPRILIHSSSFWHDLNCANTVGSIWLEARKAGVGFITPFEILAAKASDGTRDALEPFRFNLSPINGKPRFAIPDYVFGLRKDATRVRYFWFEQDQKSEAIDRKNSHGISIVKKLANCEEVLSTILKGHLDPLYVMTATVSHNHLINIKEAVKLKDTRRFLFKAIPLPLNKGRVPLPTTDVVNWELIGHTPLNIFQ